MAISVTITGETYNELRANLEALLNGSPYRTTINASKTEIIPAETIVVRQPEEEEPKKERKSRETKKKDEVKVEAPTPPPSVTPANDAATLDNCRNWVKEVAAKKDLEVAKDVIVSFGVAKVSDLPETKYADFIKACKEAIAGKSKELFA